MIELPPSPPAVAQLVRCGVKADGLRVHFDEVLQSGVVTISRRAGATASMFICIRTAAWAKFDVSFEDKKLEVAYREFDREVGKAESQAQARASLAERGLRDSLPTIKDGETVSSLISRVERFCSIKPGTALEEVRPGLISIKSEYMTIPPKPELEFECLMNVLSVLDLEKHNFHFGFIGNEALVHDDQD